MQLLDLYVPVLDSIRVFGLFKGSIQIVLVNNWWTIRWAKDWLCSVQIFIAGLIRFYLMNTIVSSMTFYATNLQEVISTVGRLKSSLIGRLMSLEDLPQPSFLIFQPFVFFFFPPLTVFVRQVDQSDYSDIVVGSMTSVIVLHLIVLAFYSIGIKKYGEIIDI
jgi:hypothetical protein